MYVATSPSEPLPDIAASASPEEVTATVPFTTSVIPGLFLPNAVTPKHFAEETLTPAPIVRPAAFAFSAASPTRMTELVSPSPVPLAEISPVPVIETAPLLIHSARASVAAMFFPFKSSVMLLVMTTVEESATFSSSTTVSPAVALATADANDE